MSYLVTGGAGFVGSHLVEALLRRGEQVVCLDNFNSYYDPARKRRTAAALAAQPGFTLVEGDLRDAALVADTIARHRPRQIAHLAAMAGPRPSVADPALYTAVNVAGTVTLLEAAVRHGCQGFLLASTSSVYGLAATPWSEDTPTDRPLSPYAASKKAAEVMAYAFHAQHALPTRVVRFFTVYGPRGRPDMTPHVFVDAMVARRPITLFNGGQGVFRDWTYVDDIVAGTIAALDADLPYEIFNLGNATPIELRQFVDTLEEVTGMEAHIEHRPLPAADPPRTFADTAKAARVLGFAPRTHVAEGLERFWAWYRAEVLDQA